MKEFWYWPDSFDKKLISAAIEAGAKVVILEDPSHVEDIKALGKIKVASKENGDYKLGEDIQYVLVKDKESEELAAKFPPHVKVIVETTDWTIIPLENLIAQREELYAVVKNEEEAKLAIKILEKGVKGVVLKSSDINTIKKVGKAVEESQEKLNLVKVTIKRILPIGLGDRVCVDTTSLLSRGEGMLVGNSSGGMFLVHAETEESPYVAARPFRVNAGAVHMYIRVPENKTMYLCELNAGTPVMVYNYKGEGRVVYVGRAKVERRPMLLIEGISENGKKVSAVLQNAETIRLTKPDGSPISVAELKEGDEVLGYVEQEGRHFGIKVEETIIEK